MNEYRWDDLRIGLKHGFEAEFSISQAQEFAILSGDTNPLHSNVDCAQAAGFASPVLFGMMTSSLYSRLVGVYLPGKHALLQGIDIDFSRPCYPGERLRCEGEVVFMSSAFRRFEIKATIRKLQQELVSKARIRVGFSG